jgi:hypothetical protein
MIINKKNIRHLIKQELNLFEQDQSQRPSEKRKEKVDSILKGESLSGDSAEQLINLQTMIIDNLEDALEKKEFDAAKVLSKDLEIVSNELKSGARQEELAAFAKKAEKIRASKGHDGFVD